MRSKPLFFSFATALLLLVSVSIINAQTVVIGCQNESDAVIGLDRKDWNNGNTGSHSEGYMNNFDMPSSASYTCKKISEINITIDNISVVNNFNAGCGSSTFYINIYFGCGSTAPASCPTSSIIAEFPLGSLTPQDLTYTCPTNGIDFDFDEILAVDIIPLSDNFGCPDGQALVSSGQITITYETCVEIELIDGDIDTPVNLGPDIDVCNGQTTSIDAGAGYDMYDWSPNGQSSQMITEGDGTYEVTVTDAAGCTDTDEIIVTEDGPTVTITTDDADNFICQNGTVTLTANTSASDIEWSNGDMTTTTLVMPGTYMVTVTDGALCTAETSITIDQWPNPVVDITPTSASVCDDIPTLVEATAGYPAYAWSDGTSMANANLPSGTHMVTVTDANGCTNSTSIVITNIDSPNAGTDNSLSVCNDGQGFDISVYLGTHDAGGIWTDLDNSTVDININPTNTTFLNITPGSYDFIYTVTATAPCLNDEALITITVEDAPNAGTDNNDIICNDGSTVDLEFLLGTFDPGGSWEDTDNSMVNLSFPTMVNFNSITAGSYDFTYTVDGNDPCMDASAVINITVEEEKWAGDDNQVSICEGGTYNLFDALSVGYDIGGSWTDDDLSGSLVGSLLNTTGLSGQVLDFTYTVGTAGVCGQDQATIEVSIVNSLSAGMPIMSSTYCLIDTLDLYDFFTDEDPGGTFTDIDGSNGLQGNLIIPSLTSAGTFNFQYSVGDGMVCPIDMATVEITFVAAPTFEIIGGNTFCNEECSTIELVFTGDPDYLYDFAIYNEQNVLTGSETGSTSLSNIMYTVCNDGGAGDISNDTIHIGNSFAEWYILGDAIGNDDCSIVIPSPDTIFFQVADSYTALINPTLCAGDSVVLNNIVYNSMNPTGMQTVTNTNDCDSIYTIDLSFFPSADALINDALCTGQELIINGTTYNEMNPTGFEMLDGMGQNGCDSTITIDLSFTDDFDMMFQLELCTGDSIFLENAWQFNPGTFTDNLISQAGCDSTVTTMIDFIDSYDIPLSENVCEGDSIFLDGAWQFAPGEFIENLISSGGCDSIVTTTVIFTPCAGNVDIQITNNKCFGGSDGAIEISIDGGALPYTVNWTGNGQMGTFMINQLNVFEGIFGLESDSYEFQLFDASGTLVGVYPLMVVDDNPQMTGTIEIDQGILCFDSSDGILNAQIMGGGEVYDYAWSPNLGNIANPTGLGEGTYVLTVTDQFDCTIELQQTLTNPDLLDFTFTSEDITCASNNGGVFEITGIIGGTSPYMVFVDGVEINSPFMIDGLIDGMHSVEVVDINNCNNLQTFTISSESGVTFELSVTDASCSGASNGTISVFNISGGNPAYTININGMDVGAMTDFTDLASDTYSIVVTDTDNCSSTQMITVGALPDPDLLDYTTEYFITQGDTVSLDGNFLATISEIIWATDSSLSCTNCPNPLAYPLITTDYTLLVTDENGCTESITVTVNVEIPDKAKLYVSNIFSPNGDGFNDSFDVLCSGDNNITVLTYSIFDRWGNLIYDNPVLVGPNFGWDGTFNGKDVLPGVYVYLIQYNPDAFSEPISLHGEFTLIK